MKIAANNIGSFQPILKSGYKNIVYTGRGGHDMLKAIMPLIAEDKLTKIAYNTKANENHSARQMTIEQCRLFNSIPHVNGAK